MELDCSDDEGNLPIGYDETGVPDELFVRKKKVDPKVKERLDAERGFRIFFINGVKICECLECKKRYNFNIVAIDHVNAVHRGVIHECTECDYTTKRLKSLNNHRRKVHQILGMKCPLCNFKSVLRPAMVSHMKEKHPEAEIPEKFEAEFKPSKQATKKTVDSGVPATKGPHGKYSTHYSISHHPETYKRQYYCNHCDYTHYRYNNMAGHVESIHLQCLNKCTLCSYTTYNMKTFYTHLTTVHKMKKQACIVPGCGFRWMRDKVFHMHLWKKHSAVYDENEHSIKVFQ